MTSIIICSTYFLSKNFINTPMQFTHMRTYKQTNMNTYILNIHIMYTYTYILSIYTYTLKLWPKT